MTEMRVYNEKFTNRKDNIRFPLLLVKDPSDALAVFINSAQKGDLPLVINYDGSINMIAEIERSLVNFERLLKAFKLQLCISKTEAYNITKLSNLLEIEAFELLPSLKLEDTRIENTVQEMLLNIDSSTTEIDLEFLEDTEESILVHSEHSTMIDEINQDINV